MKKTKVMKFLTVLCLSAMVMACSGKKTVTVFKGVSEETGFYIEAEQTYYSKGDKVLSTSQKVTIDFTKSMFGKEDFENEENTRLKDLYQASPAVKRYEILSIDDNKAVIESELDYSEKNLVELLKLGLVSSLDNKPPKFVSLKATTESLLAMGYEITSETTK